MITAPHNAPRYNGVKLKAAYAGSALPEQCRRNIASTSTKKSGATLMVFTQETTDYGNAAAKKRLKILLNSLPSFCEIGLRILLVLLPAVLFDEIKDYPKGYRILTGILSSPRRLALTMNLEPEFGDREFIAAWRKRMETLKPVPARRVSDGPVMENIYKGEVWGKDMKPWGIHLLAREGQKMFLCIGNFGKLFLRGVALERLR
jgi:hypothetical protein